MNVFHLRPRCLSHWPLAVYKHLPYLTNEPYHTHDCYEIMIALKDGGICTVGENNYAIRSGEIFLCSPQNRHAYTIPAETVYYNLMFSDEIFSDAAKKLLASIQDGAYQLFNNENEMEQFTMLLTTLEEELVEQRLGFECKTGALMEFLLASIYRKSNELPHFAGIRSNSEVEKIIAHIQNNYNEKITLNILAKIIRRSPTYVGQLFRRVAGCPFSRFLLRFRVRKAQELLKNSSLSLTEIAYQTGFFDSAHFAKSFSAVVGISPLAYRRKISENQGNSSDQKTAP